MNARAAVFVVGFAAIVAMATGVAFELFGTGSSWLGNAWLALSMRRSAQLPHAIRPVQGVARDLT